MLLVVESKLSREPGRRVRGNPVRGGDHMSAAIEGAVGASRACRRWEHVGGSRPATSELAFFAGAKRAALAVLTSALVTTELHQVVAGATCLASVRPAALEGWAAAPIVLAELRGRGRTRLEQRAEPEGLRPGAMADVQDEGCICSW